MKFLKNKKHAVLAALVLILGVAVMANWYYTNPDSKAADSAEMSDEDASNVNSKNPGDAVYVGSSEVSDEYFAGAKLSRDESYDKAVATL